MTRPLALALGAALLLGACADVDQAAKPLPVSDVTRAPGDAAPVSDVATALTVYRSPG